MKSVLTEGSTLEGVLRGESAIVQMPTSAGKTKATELVVRSAFLAERTSLAIIIAPFRALCHEIKNSLSSAFLDEYTKVDELSDALQADFELADLLGHQQILVVIISRLQFFQKQLKYGLPTETAIALYEIGFSDRVIAKELSGFIVGTDRPSVKRSLLERKPAVTAALAKYPSYYSKEIYGKLA